MEEKKASIFHVFAVYFPSLLPQGLQTQWRFLRSASTGMASVSLSNEHERDHLASPLRVS